MSRRSLSLVKWNSHHSRIHESGPIWSHQRNFSSHLRQWLHGLRNRAPKENEKSKLSSILNAAKTQCNVYISQRLKRLQKIYSLYQQAYNEHANSILFQPIIKRFLSSRSLPLVIGACGFKWHEDGISDEEIIRQIESLKMLQHPEIGKKEIQENLLPNTWENILNEDDIKMWKYPSAITGLMEYKILGTFHDISAQTFYNLQINMEYRKQWDDLVVKIEVVDEHKSRNEQVLQWVTHFTYPLSPREYLCTRRTLVDEKNKIMVISARSVSHPKCQPCKKYVRVTTYVSHMVIKPHKSFDEQGFDYLMTYSDDPQTVFPTRLTSWVISHGVPDYIKKLHSACLNINKSNKGDQQNNSSLVRMPYELNQN